MQGLGYVGAAMAMAVAEARDSKGAPRYDVVGIDLPTEEGERRIADLNRGRFPFPCLDPTLEVALGRAQATGNFHATSHTEAFGVATVVVVDVPFHIERRGEALHTNADAFVAAIVDVGRRVPRDCLVLLESTVPPMTCEHLVLPALREVFEGRGLPAGDVLLAHSYERVMPGAHYLDSIVRFWRVYAGIDERSADRCEQFLGSVIDVANFPLTRLHSTVASETAKVLENSYRSATIAMMEEWGRFAEAAGVDLFQVLDAIRVRPTHSNIRTPGFGVGGYCLTKDPLLAEYTATALLDRADLDFPIARAALAINAQMPGASLDRLESLLGGCLTGKRVLLLGVSYRQDVGDTRYSPAETFVREARRRGAEVACHDPYVEFWPEMALEIDPALPAPGDFDAVVLAVPHATYRSLDWIEWVGASKPLILDSNDVLSSRQRAHLRALDCRVESIGRGSGL